MDNTIQDIHPTQQDIQQPLQSTLTAESQSHLAKIVVIVVSIILIFVCIGVYILFIHNNTVPTKTVNSKQLISTATSIPLPKVTPEMLGSIEWSVPTSSLSPQIEREIKDAFKNFNSPFNNDNHLVVISIETSTISANFASAGMEIKDKNNNIVPSDGFEYLLSNTQQGWKIIKGDDSNFCTVLTGFPSDMLESRKDYYIGCFPR